MLCSRAEFRDLQPLVLVGLGLCREPRASGHLGLVKIQEGLLHRIQASCNGFRGSRLWAGLHFSVDGLSSRKIILWLFGGASLAPGFSSRSLAELNPFYLLAKLER